MKESLKKIILAYLSEKRAQSNYVKPLRQDMPNYPFYNEQEKTYTDLSQLDSQHGVPTTDVFDKMFIYPENHPEQWTNVDWGGGNFSAPYDEEIFHKELWRTPNDAETLWDPKMTSPEMMGLNQRTSFAIDKFLDAENKVRIKISCMDLTDFMKVSDDLLVHKSKKDLWKMYKDADGNLFITRLFEGDVLPD